MTAFTPMPLADKQQLLVKLCEQYEDAIFILDANLYYLSVNATYERMIGYTEDFYLGVRLVYTRLNFYQKKKDLF